MKLIEVERDTSRASEVRALLEIGRMGDEAYAKVAVLLRKELDAIGETKWLKWCEREFGWKRTAAYRHLNPELLQKDRDAHVPNSERCQNDRERSMSGITA